jgi:hypothetical protein
LLPGKGLLSLICALVCDSAREFLYDVWGANEKRITCGFSLRSAVGSVGLGPGTDSKSRAASAGRPFRRLWTICIAKLADLAAQDAELTKAGAAKVFR